MRSDHCIILTGLYVFEILVDLESHASLMLFFELDPDDIGTPRLDENVTRKLRAIVNIAEKAGIPLSSYREYEPDAQEVVFS